MNLHIFKLRRKDFTRERSSRLLTIFHKFNTEIKLKSLNFYSFTYFSVFVVLIKQNDILLARVQTPLPSGKIS